MARPVASFPLFFQPPATPLQRRTPPRSLSPYRRGDVPQMLASCPTCPPLLSSMGRRQRRRRSLFGFIAYITAISNMVFCSRRDPRWPFTFVETGASDEGPVSVRGSSLGKRVDRNVPLHWCQFMTVGGLGGGLRRTNQCFLRRLCPHENVRDGHLAVLTSTV